MSPLHPDTQIPDLFRYIWRSGQHVGALAPAIVVEIQKGHFKHGVKKWDGDDISATIHGESKQMPFRGYWVADTPWVQLPGILEFTDQHDFSSKGMKVGTVTMENVGASQVTGLSGVYHLIERGYLSPFRGFSAPNRPLKSTQTKNAWYDVLARKARIRVWQGFGEPQREDDGSMPDDGGSNGAWTFNGLIDDIDLGATPAQIQLSCRMGCTVTDQHLFGWAKSKTVLDPITFADRLEADKTKYVGGQGEASSSRGGYPARFAVDESSKTAWQSNASATAAFTEWIQIRLPQGRYSQFVLHPAFAGMEVFVGLFLKDQKGGKKARIDGEAHDSGWYYAGEGSVPGANGGWPYFRHMPTHSANQFTHQIGHEIEVGDDTILRVGFRKLSKVSAGHYRAGCVRLQAQQRSKDTDTKEKLRWVLVDDVSDMVKVVLRWAGFEEWDVEQSGVRMKGKLVLNRANFHIDAITKAAEQTGFVFFIDDPPTGESHGIPVFRKNSAVESYDGTQEVRDTDLLTGIKVKISEEPLAYNIRVRGKKMAQSKGGITLGADNVFRVQYYYKPPWARKGRLSGVLKHVAKTYDELSTVDECKVGAHLAALEQALQAVTATVEIPGNPYFRLDSQVGILDTATGMNTRMWVTNRTSDHRTGENAKWSTSLGGSMIDTPDIVDLLNEIEI